MLHKRVWLCFFQEMNGSQLIRALLARKQLVHQRMGKTEWMHRWPNMFEWGHFWTLQTLVDYSSKEE